MQSEAAAVRADALLFLAQVGQGGDAGEPAVVAQPDSEQAAVFRSVAQKVAAQVSVLNARRPAAPRAPIKVDFGVNYRDKIGE